MAKFELTTPASWLLGVHVDRAPGCVPGSIEAELVDLSRSGVGLRSTVPLAEAEGVVDAIVR